MGGVRRGLGVGLRLLSLPPGPGQAPPINKRALQGCGTVFNRSCR